MDDLWPILTRSLNEIQSLRRRNEILEARNDVVEIFAAVAGARRSAGGAMAPDPAYDLMRKIRELEAAEQANKGDPAAE